MTTSPLPPVVYVRSERARRYRLALGRDGSPVATIPRRGSRLEAERFVEKHLVWLRRALERSGCRPRVAQTWTIGTSILWRGELAEIRAAAPGGSTRVCVASDVFAVPAAQEDLRPALVRHFVRRARIELPARAWELAAVTRSELKQISVRNQRTRWGSCSARGVVSLNWRLVLTPDRVRDYIIYHELMHLREMNHSVRFWAQVAEVCPGWREDEAWIRQNAGLAGL
jgi:predicted metal-dependent hydrolase